MEILWMLRARHFMPRLIMRRVALFYKTVFCIWSRLNEEKSASLLQTDTNISLNIYMYVYNVECTASSKRSAMPLLLLRVFVSLPLVCWSLEINLIDSRTSSMILVLASTRLLSLYWQSLSTFLLWVEKSCFSPMRLR